MSIVLIVSVSWLARAASPSQAKNPILAKSSVATSMPVNVMSREKLPAPT